jgi:hypothetical protein
MGYMILSKYAESSGGYLKISNLTEEFKAQK